MMSHRRNLLRTLHVVMLCCIFVIQTMKPFIISETVTQDHWQCHS